MILSKQDLREYLQADFANFQSQGGKLRYNLFCNPISDQQYIWKYIVALRHVEFCMNSKGIWMHKIMLLYWLRKLRKISYKTGFQISLNTCGKGLTIWHWGPIIIIGAAQIGENCTLYPGVLIGQKTEGQAAKIGNNAFIGAGTKIIGDIHIGDNVTIGQNCVITKDMPANSVVVMDNRQLRYLK